MGNAQNDAEVSPTPKPGQVFGKPVSWQVWPMGPQRVMAEVIVPPPQRKGVQLHLFAYTPDEAALAPLLEMSASLRPR